MRLGSWLIHRLGPRALLALMLLLVALGSVALGLANAIRDLDAGLLLPMATLGLLVGWGLARPPLPGWLGALVTIGLGIETVAFRVGRLGRPLVALLQALASGCLELAEAWVWRISQLYAPVYDVEASWLPDVRPILLALGELGSGISTLSIRLRDWSLAWLRGQPVVDPVAAALVWSLVLWSVAAWAGWSVRRRGQPLPGLTPAGLLLSCVLFYVNSNPAFLLPLLGATWILEVLIGQDRRERRWTGTGVDYPLDVGVEVAFGGVVLSLVLVTTAAVMPSISVQQIVEWSNRQIGKPIGQEQPGADSLGLNPRASLPGTLFDEDQIRTPGLPRHHLLGSGPELSEQIVMLVYPDPDRDSNAEMAADPTPPLAEETYWRCLTYDRYTGHGWSTTRAMETIPYRAGDLAIFEDRFEQAEAAGRRKIRTEFRAVGDSKELLCPAGDLVTVDQSYRVAWRSPEDAFGAAIISMVQGTDREAAQTRPIIYQADSLVPAIGEAQLRAAGSDYPEWVRVRYLALPDGIPGRVQALARDLTGIAPTPYDRARAIEVYLRTFPYTLDLPQPPSDRDVVDYFLFDLKQGYCDYYATSMVVLARAAGLPARLAIGYASQTYEKTNDRYVVTKADAHAWPEIYFPSYGWVGFEPTAGRPPIDRPGSVMPIVPPELETPVGPAATDRTLAARLWWAGLSGGFALLGLGGMAWLAVDGWRLNRQPPAAAVAVIYQRLVRQGQRLGVPLLAGDTPYEFAAALTGRVTDLAQGKSWQRTLEPAAAEAGSLVDLYVKVCYSPFSPDKADSAQAIQTWKRLRRRLLLVWMFPKYLFKNNLVFLGRS